MLGSLFARNTSSLLFYYQGKLNSAYVDLVPVMLNHVAAAEQKL